MSAITSRLASLLLSALMEQLEAAAKEANVDMPSNRPRPTNKPRLNGLAVNRMMDRRLQLIAKQMVGDRSWWTAQMEIFKQDGYV